MEKEVLFDSEQEINKRPERVIIERPIENDSVKQVNGNYATVEARCLGRCQKIKSNELPNPLLFT